MPWYVKVGDKRVNCDDLPIDVYATIEKDTSVAWYDLLENPMRYAAAGPALLRAAAASVGVEPPANITPKILTTSFTLTDSDMPTMYDDDGLPNSEGAPTTV